MVTIIRVDRSVAPSPPRSMLRKTFAMPEYQMTGPSEYDLSKIELWLHPEQRKDPVEAVRVWGNLEEKGLLERCLNLRDAEEIQKRGLAAYRELFAGKSLFIWKSIMRSRGTHLLRVPYLSEYNNTSLIIGWLYMDQQLAGTGNPVALYPSP